MTRFELFWRGFWLVVRRAPRDKRAFLALASLFGIVAYIAYLVWTLFYLGVWGSISWMVMLGLGAGLAVLIRRHNSRPDESMLSLSSYRDIDSQEFAHHRPELVKVLLRAAILVDRAGIEALIESGKVPDEHRGISRRRTLDLARQPNLWNGFTEEERMLLMSAEGSWERGIIWAQINLIENVRVLRWVIQLDSILVPFEFLQPDLTPAIELTSKPEMVEGVGCLPPWDLRPERDSANFMLNRCMAEGLERGFFKTEGSSQAASDLLEFANQIKRDQSRDLVVGAETVEEASEERIRTIAQLALSRATILERIIQFLAGTSSGWQPEAEFSERNDTDETSRVDRTL
jgi:hypothetical protein